MEEEDLENKVTYIKFIEGLEKAGLDLDDVNNNWIYAGGFSNTCNTEQEKSKDNELRTRWFLAFPGEEIPDKDPADYCICETEIKYNHILVNKKLYDETKDIEYIIIGSECVRNFCTIGLKVTRPCANPKCKERHRNRKTDYCNFCRTDKMRICHVCSRKISKGKKRIDKLYCSQFCKRNDKEKKYYIAKEIRSDVLWVLKKLKVSYTPLKPTPLDYSNYKFHYKDQLRLESYFNDKHKKYSLRFKNFEKENRTNIGYCDKKKIKRKQDDYKISMFDFFNKF